MIKIDAKKEYDLNNMNVASQNIQLGTYLNELSGSISGSSPTLEHNTLSKLQGGASNEYYHLTQTDYSKVLSISGSGFSAQHNNLLGLDGGTSGSYFHLTKENYDKISGSSNSAQFGTSPNYTSFDNNGFQTMSGSARYWDDIMFPLTTAKQGQTDKPPFDTNEIAYLFPSGDTSHIMYIVAQFPHSWAEGTNIEPHIHWKQTQSGSPVFKLDYKWFPIGGSVPGSFNTFVMSNRVFPYTSGSIHQLNSGSAPINGSGITGVSSIMLIKLYRDDTSYTGNVITYQFDIHILKDTLGSRASSSK
jgi:hypothetical protein